MGYYQFESLFIGDPIDCIVNDVPTGVMDTYCWIHSTFTLPYRDVDEQKDRTEVARLCFFFTQPRTHLLDHHFYVLATIQTGRPQ